MKAIYMTGFMGAGKTTVARLLAKRLGVRYFDTDEEVVKSSGKSINTIFMEDGEAVFREMETSALMLLPKDHAIIATGGGIVLSEKNRLCMKERGIIVYLHTELEEIKKRLKEDDTRPLLKGNEENKIAGLYMERLSLYLNTANFMVDTTECKPDEIASVIQSRLQNCLPGHNGC
ncbi:shikimate kinase [Bacillus massilinigeriensis]|uniref:shikimate kinase n=1 Tax=Bacillus mediterraneensis TaxID=1805474 RepID=UPI0008F92588|nr:shikimate kinase [Bacillus mediterraneensis]